MCSECREGLGGATRMCVCVYVCICVYVCMCLCSPSHDSSVLTACCRNWKAGGCLLWCVVICLLLEGELIQ